jgi:hypothetical protein
MPTNEDDWFDMTIELDSNFGVDPFLIYQDDSPAWGTAHESILLFFGMAFDCVRQADGNKNSVYWKMAEQLLLFPEPPEFCLGVSEKSPFGSGSGEALQKEMLETIALALSRGRNSIPHMEYLDVLAGGIGLDRMGDMTCNILKRYFVQYTQGICARHEIPTQSILLHNADWDAESREWISKKERLPINPAYAAKRLPILLVPEAFIRDIPVASADGFWSFAAALADLRTRFNIDLSKNATRQMKAALARQSFPLVDDYFEKLEHERHDSYPIDDDPHRLLNPGQTATKLLADFPDVTIPEEQSAVPRFVEGLVESFVYSIEQKGIWRSLWYKDRGLPEANAQRLFYLTAVNFCRHHGVTVSPEHNAGRGPVDFVFGKKWKDRALVELKLVRNTAFWDGIMKQVPAYAKAEEIHSAFFMGIAYTDEEMGAASREMIEKAAALASEKNGITIQPLVIDARRKVSASKERMTPDERAALQAALKSE